MNILPMPVALGAALSSSFSTSATALVGWAATAAASRVPQPPTLAGSAALRKMGAMAKAQAAAIKARRNYADAIRADKSLSVKEKRDKLKAAEAQEQVIYDRYLEVFKSRTRQ